MLTLRYIEHCISKTEYRDLNSKSERKIILKQCLKPYNLIVLILFLLHFKFLIFFYWIVFTSLLSSLTIMGESQEERWLTYCRQEGIEVKSYPNCFQDGPKKKKSKKIEEHSTSTVCSEGSIDSDSEGLFKLVLPRKKKCQNFVNQASTSDEPPTVIFDLVPTPHQPTSPESVNCININSCESSNNVIFNPVSEHVITVTSTKPIADHDSSVNRIKCECGKRFKSCVTMRLHKARECATY